MGHSRHLLLLQALDPLTRAQHFVAIFALLARPQNQAVPPGLSNDRLICHKQLTALVNTSVKSHEMKDKIINKGNQA